MWTVDVSHRLASLYHKQSFLLDSDWYLPDSYVDQLFLGQLMEWRLVALEQIDGCFSALVLACTVFASTFLAPS